MPEVHSTETVKARRVWTDISKALRDNSYRFRPLYPAKLYVKSEGKIKLPMIKIG